MNNISKRLRQKVQYKKEGKTKRLCCEKVIRGLKKTCRWQEFSLLLSKEC